MNLGLALLIIFLVLIFRGSIKRYAKKKKLEMKRGLKINEVGHKILVIKVR